MIYAFARALELALSGRGFPYRVTYTPFLDTKTAYGSSIVVARTRGANERIAPPVAPHRNPKSVLTRYLGADVYVFAKSSKPGARVNEHEDECDLVVDGVLTAADLIVRGTHHGVTFQVLGARYLTPEERSALGGFVEQWPGVVYCLTIVVPRGVVRLTYAGAGVPEGVVGEVDTEVIARVDPAATAESVGEVIANGATA